jgi:signal transduction histidine kinase
LLTAVAVAVLVVVSITFARTTGLVAALWGAGGLAVAVWLRTSRSAVYDLCIGALIMVGVLSGNLLVGNSPELAAMFTVANMLDIGIAVLLARRFAPRLSLQTLGDASRFLISTALAAPIPAAAFAAGMLYLMTGAPFAESFQTWWFGHALSIAAITGFGLTLTPHNLRVLRSPLRMLEAALLFGLLTGLGIVSFTQFQAPVTFVLIPLLLLVAVRFRVLGVAASLLIIAVLAVGGAMSGYGPFSHSFDRGAAVTMAQVLVLVGYLPILLVAALLEERDGLAHAAREGQLRAERASAAKSRLLANVAHEIKSPVAGVIGIGELWASGQLGPITPTQGEMAATLIKTARDVEGLALDLLDVARAEAGAVKVELRPTDVRGLLEDVRRATALLPEAQGVRIETDCDGPLIAVADSQRLAQVLGNLATNAVKYGGAGGVIAFRGRRVDGVVRIEVVDQGPGLTIEKQAQLFEPFNRLGLERTALEGHGVGLAIAKRLTELQGGRIGVSSSAGHGALFWVELPAA